MALNHAIRLIWPRETIDPIAPRQKETTKVLLVSRNCGCRDLCADADLLFHNAFLQKLNHQKPPGGMGMGLSIFRSNRGSSRAERLSTYVQ